MVDNVEICSHRPRKKDSSPFVFVQCECYIIIFLLVLRSINSQKGMERMNPTNYHPFLQSSTDPINNH